MPTALLILLLAAGWILAMLTIIVFVRGAERCRRAERDHLAAAADNRAKPAEAAQQTKDVRAPLS